LISKARYKYDRFPKNNSQENQEISILRMKEATTRFKLCLEVKEGPQNKDYQNWEGGATHEGRTRAKRQ